MTHRPRPQAAQLVWLHAATCVGAIALLVTAASTRLSGAQAPGLERLLAYDTEAPLDVHVLSASTEADVTIQDIRFASVAGGQPTEAYLVRPARPTGELAGVLFVHWYEPHAPSSNRTQFLEEARELARLGTVSLLVSTMWSDPEWYGRRTTSEDFARSVAQARELRRALDVLLAQPQVDPTRVGYVGHDFGAMFGALIAGVEDRVSAYALIAGTGRFPDWYLYAAADPLPAGSALAAYKHQLAPIDPITALASAKGSFFFQFGEQDFYTPRDAFIAFYRAAPAPTRIATYPSGHAMDAQTIRAERATWLAEQLQLPPPDRAL